MTKDEIIKAAASKLMGWKLPQGFCPDAYITFDRVRAAANNCTPTGTNLLHLGQALEMFEYCLGEVLATEIAAAEKRGAEQREAELMAVGMDARVDMYDATEDAFCYSRELTKRLLAAARLQALQEGTEQGMQFEYTRLTERITELLAERDALQAQLAEKREPLTDAQLFNILTTVDPMTRRLPIGFKAFARAIEAAYNSRSK